MRCERTEKDEWVMKMKLMYIIDNIFNRLSTFLFKDLEARRLNIRILNLSNENI